MRTLNRSVHSKLPKVVTSKGGSAYYLELGWQGNYVQ